MAKSENAYLLPDERAAIWVEGPDARTFLQGIITNDIEKVSPARAIWAALLTPQGKYLHDFFIAQIGERLVLDCEAERRADLFARLRRHRLRSKVELNEADDLAVALLWGGETLGKCGLPRDAGATRAIEGGVLFADPRHEAAGARAILAGENATTVVEGLGFVAGEAAVYDAMRIRLGLPDGARDLEVGKALMLENGFDELHGLDWNKGCYMGQELTARTHYRALIKKRLMPVEIDGPPPVTGAPVMRGDREAGEVRSVSDDVALALLRLEAVDAANGGEALTAGEATLTPRKPDWAAF